jgi:hypothetical protein
MIDFSEREKYYNTTESVFLVTNQPVNRGPLTEGRCAGMGEAVRNIALGIPKHFSMEAYSGARGSIHAVVSLSTSVHLQKISAEGRIATKLTFLIKGIY